MAYLRSAVIAFVVFVPLLVLLWIVWAAVLIGLAEASVPLGDAAAIAILAFAVLSGLGLYLFLLSRRLGRVGIPSEARWRHLATAGLLPVAATIGLLWVVVSNLRFGF